MIKPVILLLSCGIALSSAATRAEECVLTVKGTAGAHLWVDGRSYGPLPREPIRLAPGPHEITLDRPGYERIREKVHLFESRGETRVHYLHKKRRQDGLWRGLLVPGRGVAYNERPVRGALYLVAEAALLGYAAWQEGSFQDRREEYEKANASYRSAVTDQAIAETRAVRDGKYDAMADAESDRDDALLAAAAVYGLSLLDALFLFPFGDLDDAGPVAIGPSAVSGGGAAIALRVRW